MFKKYGTNLVEFVYEEVHVQIARDTKKDPTPAVNKETSKKETTKVVETNQAAGNESRNENETAKNSNSVEEKISQEPRKEQTVEDKSI